MSGSSDEQPQPQIASEDVDSSLGEKRMPSLWWSSKLLLQIPFILLCLTLAFYIQRQRESAIWERIQTLERILDQHQAEAAQIHKAEEGVKVTKASDGKLQQILQEAVLSDAELAMDVRQTSKRGTEFQDRLTKVLRGLGEGLLDLRKRTTPDKGMTLQGFESSQLPAAWGKLEKLKSRINGFSIEDVSHSVNRLKDEVKDTFQEVMRLGGSNQGLEQSRDVAGALDRLKSVSASVVPGNPTHSRAGPEDWESRITLGDHEAPVTQQGQPWDSYRGYDTEELGQHGIPQSTPHMPQAHSRPVGLVEASEYLAPKHVRPPIMDLTYPESEELEQYEAPPSEPEPRHASMHWVQEPDTSERFGRRHWVQDYGYRPRHHPGFLGIEDPRYHRSHWVHERPEYEPRHGHWVEESSFIQATDAKSRPRVSHRKIEAVKSHVATPRS